MDEETLSALFLEAEMLPVPGTAGREWDITIAGVTPKTPLVVANGRRYIRSLNGRLYNVDVLRQSVPLWEGVKVYDNHQTPEEFEATRGMRSPVKEWLGAITNPYWDEATVRLGGRCKLIEDALATKLKNAYEAGVLNIGFSMNTLVVYGQGAVVEGQRMQTVEGFRKILSVDLVGDPAAGGGFNRLIAAHTFSNTEMTTMDEERIKQLVQEAVAAAGLTGDAVDERVRVALTEALAAGSNPDTPAPEAAAQPTADAGAVPETPAVEAAPPAPPATPATDPLVEQALAEIRQMKFERTLESKLRAAKLPAPLQRVVEAAFAGRIADEAEVDTMITRLQEANVALDATGRVTGAGNGRSAQVVIDERDKYEAEFLRLAMGNTDFRLLEGSQNEYVQNRTPAGYKAWVKAGRPKYNTTRISEWAYHMLGGNPLADERAAEAVSTSGMASIVKNAMNVMLAADFAKRTQWWEPFVREEEVDTIDQATLVRVHGMGPLDVVNEGAAYTELDWEDEEETAAFVKKGNYVGVTMETLFRDKVSVIRSIPVRLSAAWYNTLGRLVSNVFTLNTAAGPVLADGGALFNATALSSAGGHANLLTTALSFAAFGAARTAMRKQTDQVLGAGERLLIQPKYLLVPVDLEQTAIQIRDSEQDPDNANNPVNPYRGTFEVVVVPTWTDTNNWAQVGDKTEFPTIWHIFLRGKKVPELFTAGDENGGAMFTNDELRFKVRMLTYRFSSTYDCAPVSDWRALHKSNVA